MTKRTITAGVIIGTLLTVVGCGGADDKDKDAATTSAASSSGAASESGSSEESAESTSYSSPTPTTREQLPDTLPEHFNPDDLSQVYDFGYILSYVNSYPGWVKLSTEEPEYDDALGGYVVEVYFTVDGGYDIILNKEWSVDVGGQKVIASEPPAQDPNSITTWLPVRTPLGNHPEATQNYVFGDLLFVMPKTDQPLTMHYDNVDGDVHATWQKGGQGA